MNTLAPTLTPNDEGGSLLGGDVARALKMVRRLLVSYRVGVTYVYTPPEYDPSTFCHEFYRELRKHQHYLPLYVTLADDGDFWSDPTNNRPTTSTVRSSRRTWPSSSSSITAASKTHMTGAKLSRRSPTRGTLTTPE